MRLLRPIILEGPDGGGKSHLYRTLCSWGLKAAGHDGGPPEDAADVWKRLAMYSAISPAVRDRCPAISDVVYSRALGRETKVPVYATEDWLWCLDPLIIHCRPPLDKLLAHKIETKPHKPAEFVEQLNSSREAILRGYADYLAHLNLELGLYVYVYDWTQDEDVSELKAWLRAERFISCVD